MSLEQKRDEVSTNLADVMSTVVVFSASDGEADVPKQQYGKPSAKKQRIKNKNYYEQNKLRIKSNRKQRYYTNPQVQKCASHAASKTSYHTNPETNKRAAKAKYNADQEPHKIAARALHARALILGACSCLCSQLLYLLYITIFRYHCRDASLLQTCSLKE